MELNSRARVSRKEQPGNLRWHRERVAATGGEEPAGRPYWGKGWRPPNRIGTGAGRGYYESSLGCYDGGALRLERGDRHDSGMTL